MLKQQGQTRRFLDKTIIFKEGDIGNSMYIVNTGSVRIYRQREGRNIEFGTIKPGEFFGEMALFTQQNRSATAQAKGDTDLQIIDAETFKGRVKDPIIWNVITKLSERIRDIDDRIEALSVKEQVRKEHINNLVAQHRKTYY
jgi:CRP-like cAMP-binding protein